MSPTQMALKYLRDEGWTAEVVERWNPHSRTRKDLFGFIDIVAIGPGVTLGVQATSAANHSHRVKKVLSLAESWISAGNRLLVMSFRKPANQRKYVRRETAFVIENGCVNAVELGE